MNLNELYYLSYQQKGKKARQVKVTQSLPDLFK